MFKIYDGRSHFWQWDSDQKLVVNSLNIGTSVQFYNDVVKEKGYTTLVRQEPGKRVCDVPNILLQHACDLKVYAYVEDEKGNRTVLRKTFAVKKREKPAVYVYKETESTDYPKIINDALAAAKKSGMFDGEPGADGKDGKDGKDGQPGADGAPGKDGVSPTISIVPTPTGTRIIISDKNGEKYIDIPDVRDGEDGVDGIPGADGKDGEDGISPIISVSRIDTGTRLTIKDINGTTYVDIPDGKDGEPGSDYVLTDEDKDEIAALVPAGNSARIGEVTLTSSGWTGSENLYSQVVNIEGVTENTQVDLTPSVQQLAAFYEKDLAFVTENEDGVVTVYCIGQKPQNDYTIQVTMTEVSA